MVVLATCKNEEDPIKNKGDRVVTTLFIDFFRCSRATYSNLAEIQTHYHPCYLQE